MNYKKTREYKRLLEIFDTYWADDEDSVEIALCFKRGDEGQVKTIQYVNPDSKEKFERMFFTYGEILIRQMMDK